MIHRHMEPDYARRGHWGGTHASGDFHGNLSLRRIRLDRDGYDERGRYYGIDEPLWRIWNADDTEEGSEEIDFFIRAIDREAARREAVRMYPGARVYR